MGPRIVRIVCSQGIVLLGNRTKWGLVLNIFRKAIFLKKRGKYSTIQRRKLFKGGNYQLLGGFDRGNYSKEETIQGRKVYEEIRYFKSRYGFLWQLDLLFSQCIF